MKANYHTHTYRCHHAALVSDEEYVIKAIEAGFDELTFTDHVPYKSYDIAPIYRDRMDYSEIDEYLSSIRSLKEKYKDKISIHAGFESEYFPNRLDYYKELKEKVDILILGQHCVLCIGDDMWNPADDKKLDTYADYVVEGLKTGLFSILVHPDLFMLCQDKFSKKCEEISHRIAQTLQETQIPVEINFGCISRNQKEMIDGELAYPYPYRKVWEVLAQYDIKVVLGYDAHKPEILTNESLKQKALDVVKGLNLNIIDSIEI